jgi:hypothetical protein
MGGTQAGANLKRIGDDEVAIGIRAKNQLQVLHESLRRHFGKKRSVALDESRGRRRFNGFP